MGRYQEAIPLLKKQLAAYPQELWAHVNLVVTYVQLGRDREARAEAAEVIRIRPLFTTAIQPEKGVFKEVAMNQRYINDMRKAGVSRSESANRQLKEDQ
jgi:tetratricopeptide (TPR) repeat protein